ncbi:MAG: DEAD/DEAH box helicase, partial [Sphingobacteriaceae bacterium]
MLAFNQDSYTDRKTLFVEVILPLSIIKAYTYRVPFELNDQIAIGKRVVVQFGKSKVYTAIVYRITDQPPQGYEAKYLVDVLDELPIVNEQQLKLWEWMASYYLCTLGEVMQAALPSALKLASETRIILNKDSVFDRSELSDKEFLILDALDLQPELSVGDISKILAQKTVFPILRELFEKGIITISEEIAEKYQPRKKTYIKLNPFYNDAENRKQLFGILERAPKQLDLVLSYIQLLKTQPEISKSELLEASGAGAAAIKALIDKEVFTAFDKEVSRLKKYEEDLSPDFVLNDRQAEALESIQQQHPEKEVVLVHGVTSSGKTQLYIRLIEEYLKQGKQALYLLPEIGLTTQIIQRLQQYFGNQIGVYHSKFSDHERAEIWQKVLKGEYRIILGARSAVFLPFTNLGLIVVDEEHENSYKQFDPAPRYHARDTAIYLASLHACKVVLGSATP